MGVFDISKFAGTVQKVSESDMEMQWVGVESIVDNPRNFYPKPSDEDLTALMESIQANGLLEPPTVVADNNGTFRLISGHSRMEAIRQLCETEPERFGRVLCRCVPGMTEAQELAAVIEANRQRVKTPAMLAEEAAKLTEAYTERKKSGEKLPGKIRDRVAEAMNLSATKVANLKIIREGLKVPGFQRDWKEDKIPESVALEMARMDIDSQYRLMDWLIDGDLEYTQKNIQLFSRMRTLCRHKCPETAGFCSNAERMVTDKLRNGEFRCAGCCKECVSRGSCPTACKYVPKDEPAPIEKAPKPETVETENPAEIPIPSWIPLDREHWPELGQLVVLAEETGLGGYAYIVARCVGGWREEYPFIDPSNNNISVEIMGQIYADWWLPVGEAPVKEKFN